MMVVLLLAHSATQAEGEDDGEELDGGHYHHGADHKVKVLFNVPGQGVVAAVVDVGVGLGWAPDAVGILGLQQCLVSSQDAAGLGNLKTF